MRIPRKLLYLTRQVEFAAAHRLYLKELSEEENFALFGKCANPNGHGHNYFLETTICGCLSERTQMVVHYDSLKRLLNEVVVSPLDHRHLNYDVEFLKDRLPTSENLIIALWDQIQRAMGNQPWSLYRLRLQSSSKNWVEYFGPEEENNGR